jgi:hypothetical protein
MTRIAVGTVLGTVVGTVFFALHFSTRLHAQTTDLNDIKAKIFNAQLAQSTFAGGLPHCSELDGTNFYLAARDRVISLQDYHRSLDNLALQGIFNPETKKPWNQQDADTRWAEVQKEAVTDKTNCALVASLPYLQKKLDELQQQATATPPNK